MTMMTKMTKMMMTKMIMAITKDDVDDEESQGQCFENQFRYGYEEFDSEDNDDESES